MLPATPDQLLSLESFKKDEDLERNPKSTAQICLDCFIARGGNFQTITKLSEITHPQVLLHPGDAVYPICSGGVCRSQTLWAILKPFSDKLILFPPHAARHGWDPYNGQINRHRNAAQESLADEFCLYFGMEKACRFGFENCDAWGKIAQSPAAEKLKEITKFYDLHYFGPESSWQGRKGKNRIYIPFSNNAHVILYRLCQSNDNLDGVTVIAIDSEDIISHPPESLKTPPRTMRAYEHFAQLMCRLVDLT